MEKISYMQIIKNGLIFENPTLMQVLGMCPTLAVTTTAMNGVGMGLATTAVLICSNVAISLIRKAVPDTIRIPVFVVVIAAFVTAAQMLLKAYLPDLNSALGVFIPLIAVNCIILARAEAFASKNGVAASCVDGLSMGLGFCAVLTVIGSIRELLGVGSIFGVDILANWLPKTVIMVLPPGAFFTLAFIMAFFNYIMKKVSGGAD